MKFYFTRLSIKAVLLFFVSFSSGLVYGQSLKGIILSSSTKTGIGFVNVNNRIKLIYGYEYALEINSTLHAGTEVTLKIPAGRDAYVQSTDM